MWWLTTVQNRIFYFHMYMIVGALQDEGAQIYIPSDQQTYRHCQVEIFFHLDMDLSKCIISQCNFY